MQSSIQTNFLKFTGSFENDSINVYSAESSGLNDNISGWNEVTFYKAADFTSGTNTKQHGFHYKSFAGTNTTEYSAYLEQTAASTTKFGIYSKLDGTATNTYNLYLENTTGGSSNNYSIYSTNTAARMLHFGPITGSRGVKAKKFELDTTNYMAITSSGGNMQIGDINGNDQIVTLYSYGVGEVQLGDGATTFDGSVTI